MSWVFVSGRMVREEEATVPVTDHALLYGDGLFETMAVREGKPVFLEEHLGRLLAGAEYLRFRSVPERSELIKAVEEVLEANRVADGYLRLVLTRGAGPRTWEPERYGPPNVIVSAGRGRPYPAEDYERGWRAVISSFRQDHLSPLCRLKTLNFLHHVLAKREAREREADEALHLNLLGNLAEGSTANVFLVRRGEIVTPDAESGLLPGITRAVVLDLAARKGLRVLERPVRPDELRNAEEAFLTNSLLGVMPLVAVDGRPIGSGTPGPVTKSLREAYENLLDGEPG